MIIGAGEIGQHLAKRLSAENHEVVVIESDEAKAAELNKNLDARVVPGDGASADLLFEAGLAECELFVAVTTSNHTNLVCCRLANILTGGKGQGVCRGHPKV